ncbi:MAG: glycosyltransferase family 2 protein [Flavobacteriales bacterium]|nr:glycosyltransferase family 2 protein [Flavobacteriales bacterium]
MKKTLQEISDYYFDRFGYGVAHLKTPLHLATRMIIVIPVHNEPSVTATLDSLNNCIKPDCQVEVILVVNNSENVEAPIREQNIKSITEINSWIKTVTPNHLNCHVISAMDLPFKHAGVGLARKIGMDEALRRFASIDYNGLIVCNDADCTVEPSYLCALEEQFARPDFVAGNIYYEHPFSEADSTTKSGIVKYELGLRYYVNALRFAGYPYAYHTIGSSMAVSAKIYAQAGGMNKRKAGEDFYFLHKLIPLGNFEELNSTAVFPSARISHRVPFGTGRAMLKWKEQVDVEQEGDLKTYRLEVFQDLKKLIACIHRLRTCEEKTQYDHIVNKLPDSIIAFLEQQDFYKTLLSCIQQSNSEGAFLKRVYSWLDGFKVLKFVHSCDKRYPRVNVESQANLLLQEIRSHECNKFNDQLLLATFRQIDKEHMTIGAFLSSNRKD